MYQAPILIPSLSQKGLDTVSFLSTLKDPPPSTSTAAEPLRIWIIQIGVILITTQLLSLPLKQIHQPRVIAEVLGGIILSPSVLGRIPGFTRTIFPDTSKPYLLLVANIGLVLFLFLVGLEIDGNVIRRNVRMSASIALSGMLIPFGLGAAISGPLYKEFIDPNTNFAHFLLFIGVAFSITAFPVLCRILTELKLLDTTVGIVVLSAGVANDIVGWTLMALSVALASAASSLTALWILCTCIAWSIFLLVCVRRIFRWLARRTGSTENGPTTFFITATVLMVFCSAFVTDVIGVHPIFGSFLVGLIIPREGGLAIALTEKLEDIVSVIFLPLYFTQSGLSTDFGLLNDGITWAYTFAIIILAWVGKFGSCAVAAKLSGFQWREATAIGTLMSCKGLVELIVLNVGLSTGILNTRVFSMFVLEALFLTFLTTPVVVKLYPPDYRKRAAIGGPDYGTIDKPQDNDIIIPHFSPFGREGRKSRFTVVLDKLEHLSSIMTLTQLLRPFVSELSQQGIVHSNDSGGLSVDQTGASSSAHPATDSPAIQALRLIELSDRTSAVMKSSITDSLIYTDPILNVFKTFCDIHDVPVSSSLAVVPFDGFATKVTDYARENFSDLVLFSWSPCVIVPANHSSQNAPEPQRHLGNKPASDATKPIDGRFNFDITEQSSSTLYLQFVRGIFAKATVDVALFVDRGPTGFGPYSGQRVMLPFFGGMDDRLALAMVVRLCRNANTTAKIFRVARSRLPVDEPQIPDLAHVRGIGTDTLGESMIPEVEVGGAPNYSVGTYKDSALRSTYIGTNPVQAFEETLCGHTMTHTRLESDTADQMLWQFFASPSSRLDTTFSTALKRVEFIEFESLAPLREVLARIQAEAEDAQRQRERPFVVVGRGRCFPAGRHQTEVDRLLEETGHIPPEVRRTLGDVATALVVSGNMAELVVVHSKPRFVETSAGV